MEGVAIVVIVVVMPTAIREDRIAAGVERVITMMEMDSTSTRPKVVKKIRS